MINSSSPNSNLRSLNIKTIVPSWIDPWSRTTNDMLDHENPRRRHVRQNHQWTISASILQNCHTIITKMKNHNHNISNLKTSLTICVSHDVIVEKCSKMNNLHSLDCHLQNSIEKPKCVIVVLYLFPTSSISIWWQLKCCNWPSGWHTKQTTMHS